MNESSPPKGSASNAPTDRPASSSGACTRVPSPSPTVARREFFHSHQRPQTALRVHGTDAEKARLAQLTANLSFGWPQHLNIAQTAVCGELIRTRGEAGDIRTGLVRDETAAGRARYYGGRLDRHPMTRYPLPARRIVAELKTAAVSVEGPALEDFCERTVRNHDPQDRLRINRRTLEAIAGQLERRGVLARRKDCWRLAIPSMGDWAAEAVREASAHATRMSARMGTMRPPHKPL